MNRLMRVVVSVMFAVGVSGIAVAGSLDSPGAPSAGSGMPAIGDIYTFLTTGTPVPTPGSTFQAPSSGPAGTGRTLTELYSAVATPFPQCDATVDDVVAGKKFFSTQSGSWGVQTGTLNMYPVGAIYTSVDSTSPATLFGGTWVAFGAGRVLVGLDSGDGDFDAVGETGGAKTTSIAHTHTGPSHTHTHSGTTSTYTANVPTGGSSGANKGGTHNHTWSGTTDAAGTGVSGGMSANSAPSVVQPYVVVYMWKRTA